MIILKNISKDYKLGNTKVHALKNVSLEFSEKEFVCIHGPSGCGKTTLLNIIGGLDKYTSGKMYINNQDTSTFKDSDFDSYRNQEVGFVFQNYYLLPQLNVFENVELALELINLDKAKRLEMVNKALQSVGLLDQAHKMPNQLSGGQIQRVAIARAIVNEPSIILADEPTGALDSKNAKIIMDILKEISKERLVILVSHNLDLAKQYATRLIEILDGEVVSDSKPVNITSTDKRFTKKKTAMSFFTSLKISIRNLLRTKLRTPLIIFAGCIGMIGIGLVLSISKGVNLYIEDVQRQALANYPIYIYSSPKSVDDEGEEKPPLKIYPDGDEIHVIKGDIRRDYYNVMDKDFVSHVEELDSSLYTVINYRRNARMRVMTKNKKTNSYSFVSYFYFTEMTDDLSFMSEQYDKLYGEFPSNPYEVALVVSEYNSIGASILRSLDLEHEKDVVKFSEIIGKEYRVVNHNDYYVKTDTGYKVSGNALQMYENSEIKFTITAIIRGKPNAGTKIYSPGILHSKELTDLVINNNLESDIVKDQLTYGTDLDVFTNQPFEVEEGLTYIDSIMYQYEENLITLGAVPDINEIRIYTEMFHDRMLIRQHIDNYDNPDSTIEIIYSDRLNNIVDEFHELVRVFSTVLIIFSSVSLIVSSIMIGIITYVSILQRTKEIGLLRSIGARKKDIARLFNVETLVIGFMSGLFGIIGVLILLNPVNGFVQGMVSEYTFSFRGVESVIVARFELLYMLILLVGSMLLSLISGFIPALIASRKSPIDALRNER